MWCKIPDCGKASRAFNEVGRIGPSRPWLSVVSDTADSVCKCEGCATCRRRARRLMPINVWRIPGSGDSKCFGVVASSGRRALVAMKKCTALSGGIKNG